MKRFVLFLAVVLWTAVAVATDYHVDSVSGDDLQSGTTPQTAWKSLNAVNKAEFRPGDRVLFKRDGIWRGQLKPRSGEEGSPIIYGVYGEGKEKPQLRGSVPLDKPTDWIDEGNGLWSTKPDTVHVGDKVEGFEQLSWSRHQEAGADVSVRVSDPEDKKYSGRKEYRFSCKSPGTSSNHVQFIVAGFPVEADKNYLLRFAAKSTKPFALASIGFSEPGSPWGGLGSVLKRPGPFDADWKEYEILFRCKTSHEKARLTLSFGGTIPEGAETALVPLELREATVESNGIDTDVGNIILDGKKASFKKWTREDLKNSDDFWYDMEANRVVYRSKENPATLYKNIEAALHHHVVDHSNCRWVVFDGLDIRYGAAHGFGGTKARTVVYRNLDVSWIGGADQYRQGGEGRRVRFGNGIEFWADASDCLVENCRFWEIYDAALTNQGAGKNIERNLTYRNNLIWNSEYSFEYWNREEESVTENILFEGNVCVDAGFGWGHVQRPDKNGRHLMIYRNPARTSNFVVRGNIFCDATESAVRIDTDWRDGLQMERNVYWQPAEKDLVLWLVNNHYTTERFADYQKELQLDTTSNVEKPDLERFPGLPVDVRTRPR